MADTEDKRVITAQELDFEMGVTNESIDHEAEKNFEKNIGDGARIISDFVSGSVELDAEALEKMSEYIDFYLGTDPKNEEAKKLRDEAVAKVATLKEQNVAKSQAAEQAKEGEENSETGGEAAEEGQEGAEEGQEGAEAQEGQEGAEETAPATPEEQAAFEEKVTEIDAIAEANPLIDENGKFSNSICTVYLDGRPNIGDDFKELNAFYENIVDEEGQKHEGLQNDVYELALAATKQELAEMEGWEVLSEKEKARTFQRTLANNLTATTTSFVLMQEDANKGLDPKNMTKPTPERVAEAKGIISKFATDKSKPYMVSKKVLATMMGTQVADVEQRAQKLSERFNNLKPVQWIKGVDDRLTKKWPNLYPAVKQFAKGYVVTGAIASLTGPAGLAVYAGYNVYKQVKAMKDQANKSDQTFWQFMKNNKSQAVMLGLSAVSASMSAIVGIDALGNTQVGQWLSDGIRTVGENFANTQVGDWLSGKTEWLRDALPSWDNLRDYAVGHRANLGKWQGIAAMGKTFSEERKKGKSVWQSLKTASARGIGTWVAVGRGLGAHESMVAAIDGLGGDDVNAAETGTPTTSLDANGNGVIDSLEMRDANNNGIIDAFEPGNKAPEMVDADNDGISDTVDIDRGEGWATANQTQIDRLFDANPRAVNAILGGEWQSSAELHEMLENNQIGEEQLKLIHALADAQFDENGKIIDPELNKFYQEKLDQIKAEQARAAEQQRHQESGVDELKSTVKPLEVETPEPIEVKAPEIKVPNGEFHGKLDVNNDGKVDDVTVINHDGQKVVVTEFGGRGGKAEVSITDSEGDKVTVNNETLQQDGATKGEARRAMDNIVEQAKAGQYNNVDPETMKNEKGFEFTEAPKGDATLETKAAETPATPATPTTEIKYPEGTNLEIVSEEVTKNGLTIVTSVDNEHGVTVVESKTEDGYSETSVTVNNENGPATRTRYDSNNNIICVEVQDENGVWVDADPNTPTTPTVDGKETPETPTTPSVDGKETPETPTTPSVDGKETPETPATPTVDGKETPETPTTPTVDGTVNAQGVELDTNPNRPQGLQILDKTSTLGWKDGENLKNGEYIAENDTSGRLQILGRDNEGNLFKITEGDAGSFIDLPKDHPHYDDLNTPIGKHNSVDAAFAVRDLQNELLGDLENYTKVETNSSVDSKETPETPTTPTVDGKETPETPTTPSVDGKETPETPTTPSVDGKETPETPATPTVDGKETPETPATPTVDGTVNAQGNKNTATLLKNLQMGKNINLNDTTQATANNTPTKLNVAQVMARGNGKV